MTVAAILKNYNFQLSAKTFKNLMIHSTGKVQYLLFSNFVIVLKNFHFASKGTKL